MTAQVFVKTDHLHCAFVDPVTTLDEQETTKDERGIIKTKDYPFTKTWAAMENIYLNSKKARTIGVSNFSVKK